MKIYFYKEPSSARLSLFLLKFCNIIKYSIFLSGNLVQNARANRVKNFLIFFFFFVLFSFFFENLAREKLLRSKDDDKRRVCAAVVCCKKVRDTILARRLGLDSGKMVDNIVRDVRERKTRKLCCQKPKKSPKTGRE